MGGDYDVLFIDTPPSSISFIYRSLGAFHSLQPAPEDDGYSIPSIPALKPKGFVTWQTIQLLLGPEQHVPFLQKAVEIFDVKDPETGNVFPKVLPKECLPDRPDEAMEQWYESVAERLRKAAEREAAEKQEAAGIRVDVDEPQPRSSSEASGDERHAAASYFADPLYRNRVRPGYMRHFSKGSVYSEDRSGVVGRVRHVLNFNPFHNKERRRPSPSKYAHDEYLDIDATPIATVPPQHPASHHHRYSAPTHKRPQAPRRKGSLPTTDSDSDDVRPRSRSSPVLRHRRSHDPPATTARDYFPPYYDERERRYSHDVTPEPRSKSPDRPPPPLYGPTQTPLFATHVAKMQAQNYAYDSRPAGVPARGSYRSNTGIRYTVSPPDPDPGYLRERDRKPAEPEPVYAHSRERDRSRDEYASHSSSSRHRSEMSRRRSDEYSNERDSRGQPDSLRSIRSHDRVKDEWEGRDLSRDRERDRERDRDGRVRARYVSSSSSTQDGVGGRRYPAPEQAWR